MGLKLKDFERTGEHRQAKRGEYFERVIGLKQVKKEEYLGGIRGLKRTKEGEYFENVPIKDVVQWRLHFPTLKSHYILKPKNIQIKKKQLK